MVFSLIRGGIQIKTKIEKTGLFRKNSRGYGFVTVEGEEEDYYIAKEHIADAYHEDTVRIIPVYAQTGRSKEAKIIAVEKRAISSFVGTLEIIGRSAVVYPDDNRLPECFGVGTHKSGGAKSGKKVYCDILSYGDRAHMPQCEVVEILGDKNAPGVDILSVVKAYQVPTVFSEAVLREAKKVSGSVKKKEMKHRLDLREKRMITIDGDTTKDFDDAVSIERDGEDYILGVHIADVAHYVKEGSLLDREAIERGTSIYLADRVIPMLPEALSNGVCSLQEGEDRLALSCIMRINRKGVVKEHQIAESVIRVTHRMTYTQVNHILSGEHRKLCVAFADILGDLYLMQDLSFSIRRMRKKRGALDFDFPEAKILLDEEGHAIAVEAEERGFSQMMIEDFMVLANETVASHFYHEKIPFVYRVHDKPKEEKLCELQKAADAFGYKFSGRSETMKPKNVQRFLKAIKGTGEESLLMMLTLRSMQRAEYHTECKGHFGLASEYYCHFTSPIRRYPDLLIHRIIKESLHKSLKKKKIANYKEILPVLAHASSEAEHRAENMEREVDKMKKCEYMRDRLGESFEGRVSGITSWGMYVELPNTVEGMVPLRMMWDDHYEYEEETYSLVGQSSGRRFTLGDPVTIRVESADVEARLLDFSLNLNRRQSEEKRVTKHGHRRKKSKARCKQQKSKS